MVITATIVLFVTFFIMLFAGVPISAGIGIASVIAIVASGRSDLQGFAFTAAQKCFSGLDSFSLLALPFFSLGGNIMNKGGILAIIYREMDFKTFYNLLADTMKSSATILFLIAASSIMAYVMARTKIPAAISDMIMGVSDNRYVILLIMNVFLLVMGMFLDLTPAVLIFVPIFLPIARSIGMSDVHFGLMLITNLGIGSVTPPVGSCLFVGCGVAKVKIEGVTKYIVPIFVAMVVALFLVTYIPQISLSLPYWTKLIPGMGWNS